MKWTRKNEPTSETEMERTLTANDVNECSNQQTTSTEYSAYAHTCNGRPVALIYSMRANYISVPKINTHCNK